jgi:hypothetical protein
LLENYFLPGDLEAQIEAFVDHYNHQRFHESLNNFTPSDCYFGEQISYLTNIVIVAALALFAFVLGGSVQMSKLS